MIRNRVKWLIQFCQEMNVNIHNNKAKASIVAISMNDNLQDSELGDCFIHAYQAPSSIFMGALQTTDEFNAILNILNEQLLEG
ncbi:hypothetical protein [Photobacterium sanguinicancri]|uniref:Reverse transcriptase domain-containing protein n=1 Tax=Photobacterium sanguinicancri TaxID=875932 RepID=A0AAW7Y4C7_9GAMM|nr:hypothetical protein [Photobacterium sanguinicancri]MDO6542940.1 hypothetical protein [Photobacterium sanguinicancri]